MDEPIHLAETLDLPAISERPASFEDFVRAEHARLHRALCILTRDRLEAEEVAQDAFVRVLERWDRLGHVEDLSAYLFRVALNLVRKRARRAAMAVRRSLLLATGDEIYPDLEQREDVLRALAALPFDQRSALVVTSMLGYRSDEAAQILGVRASTVRARATRARTILRATLGPTLGEDR
jgi:RNA polymerase sigma-70 factor (ECF subfamily)